MAVTVFLLACSVAAGSLVAAAEGCKAAGLWLFAADEAAEQAAADTDLTGPVGLVLGGEGVGVRTSVIRACDGVVSLARGGALATLNVAMAGAVLLYEVRRQRITAVRNRR